MKNTIGWIGTGLMGGAMAWHLLEAGHPLRVHTRTRARAEALLQAGAHWCENPNDVAEGADIVCLMVGYPADVEELVLSEQGLLSHMTPGQLLIDFTTSRPDLAKEIAERAEGIGCLTLDAPVSGGDIGAQNATLSIMVGGPEAAFERARPLLELLGTTIVHQGPAGSGQHTKMVNQILIAGTMMGLCEALTYARTCGLDGDKVLQSVSGGAAGSCSLTHLAPRILGGDFAPGFLTKHFLKDLCIAVEAAQRMGLELPALGMAEELYRCVCEQPGGTELGTQALMSMYDEQD